MEKQRKCKLMWRWSLITAGLIALFWAIWYLVTGSVPVTTGIKMTETWTINLGFGISRWWDVLIGPIWSTMIILILTNERIQKDNDLAAGLTAGLVVGLTAGLVVGLAVGLGASLAAGLVVSLAAGLVVGLAVGLAVGLGASLAAGLVVGLVALIKWICSKSFWMPIGNWLLARNENTEEA